MSSKMQPNDYYDKYLPQSKAQLVRQQYIKQSSYAPHRPGEFTFEPFNGAKESLFAQEFCDVKPPPSGDSNDSQSKPSLLTNLSSNEQLSTIQESPEDVNYQFFARRYLPQKALAKMIQEELHLENELELPIPQQQLQKSKLSEAPKKRRHYRRVRGKKTATLQEKPSKILAGAEDQFFAIKASASFPVSKPARSSALDICDDESARKSQDESTPSLHGGDSKENESE